LIDAAWGGNRDVVKLLLDKAANINAKNKRGETALKVAYGEGARKLPVDHGAKEARPPAPKAGASPQKLQKKQDGALPRNQ
jgi:hypothetical protein